MVAAALTPRAEVKAHDNRELWPKSDDPATLHPMSARLVQILETYKRLYKETGQEQPFLKNARCVCTMTQITAQSS
jgi:transaldolase